MEQQQRICPLCGNQVKFFFINLTEKLLMCAKPDCDFPFGYEELQIITPGESSEMASNVSQEPINYQSTASSVASTSAWSDIEKLKRVYDSEDSMADSRTSFTSNAVIKHRQKRKSQKEMQDTLDQIKKLNEELNEMKKTNSNIQYDRTHNQPLTGDAVDLLKNKKEPDFGMGELKININTVPNNEGVINIEIINEEDKDAGVSQENKIRGENQENEIKQGDIENEIKQGDIENEIKQGDIENYTIDNLKGTNDENNTLTKSNLQYKGKSGPKTVKTNQDSSIKYEFFKKFDMEGNQEDDFKDQDIMNNLIESNEEEIVPKKRGRPKKGIKVTQLQPRRSRRLSLK